jgi:large subunit ribosomal protein L25
MSEDVLSGSLRQAGRKGPARKLRREGLVPGVVYGLGENITFSAPAKELLKILASKGGSHHIIRTKFTGDKKERAAMIKRLDVHPITDVLVHLDLMEIDINKPVRLKVELEFVGTARGVKEKGGVLKIALRKVDVECMPSDIPNTIVVQIAGMDLGDVLHVKDIATDSKVKILNDPEAATISIVVPSAAPVEAAPATATATAAAPATAATPAPAEKGKSGKS